DPHEATGVVVHGELRREEPARGAAEPADTLELAAQRPALQDLGVLLLVALGELRHEQVARPAPEHRAARALVRASDEHGVDRGVTPRDVLGAEHRVRQLVHERDHRGAERGEQRHALGPQVVADGCHVAPDRTRRVSATRGTLGGCATTRPRGHHPPPEPRATRPAPRSRPPRPTSWRTRWPSPAAGSPRAPRTTRATRGPAARPSGSARSSPTRRASSLPSGSSTTSRGRRTCTSPPTRSAASVSSPA